jgi:anti-sigma factor RsiW
MTHLGDRISALVDGELGHQDRDRALAHVAHCAECRAELEAQREVKQLLASARSPRPDAVTLSALQALAAPGGPVPPRARTMPQGPLVPDLPPPGRRPRGGRLDSRRPGHRTARRARVVTAGALSVAGLVLGTAFVAGGSSGSSTGPVVPPVAELSVEHGRTSTAVTVGDPGVGLMTTFDLSGPTSARR